MLYYSAEVQQLASPLQTVRQGLPCDYCLGDKHSLVLVNLRELPPTVQQAGKTERRRDEDDLVSKYLPLS